MSKQKSLKKRRGKEAAQPAINTKMMWASAILAGVGALMAVAFFLSGALYFRSMERYFADVA